MNQGHRALDTLRGNQARASDPGDDVWLSASAGTGKTHVLASRVYRLLLSGKVKPESILCLTFTKAGAAEMAERINSRLAQWVRLPGPALAGDLKALGEDFGPEAVKEARKLFARVLDARGGGLRIQTIHSFCQSLLAGFPAEIGLTPGFRAMEAREEAALGGQVLSDMVIAADAEGRMGVVDALRALVLRLSEDKTREFLGACARAPAAMAALGEGEGLRATIARALCDGLTDPDGWLLAKCHDNLIDRQSLDRAQAANAHWLTKKGEPTKDGVKAAAILRDWLNASPETRLDRLEDLQSVWMTGTGTRRHAMPDDPVYPAIIERIAAWCDDMVVVKKGAALAADIASALSLGKEYARAYSDAKRARGLVDFDDLIRKTVELLQQEGMGDWIRYKLDQSTDHILVDEAQDTNANQWAIIEALAGEFYAGEGAKGTKRRTIFTVGDYKQAIFGFQGTDPQEFTKARTRFEAQAAGAGRDIIKLSLTESFRSSPPVLAVVDAVIDEVGFERFGLGTRNLAHNSARGGFGSVTLWPPIGENDSGTDQDDDEEWITQSQRIFAAKLAHDIKQWLIDPPYIDCKKRCLQPEDIMILVRSRGDLARLIVARLHAAGVPVAGLDRLRLNAPLAVRDLLACIRFVLQPGDDLTLATLLVSPIIGWTQDQLYERAKGRNTSLWQHIGQDAPSPLGIMLGLADKITPYRFLETILSGEINARYKLAARMGHDVRDSIEELLNAALSFEREATPSLQQFLDWFDRGDVDVKRDPSAAESAVRVMTVHGAKGLQAPIVILADATRDPSVNRKDRLEWALGDGLTLPIFKPRSAEIVDVLTRAVDQEKMRDIQEHWRLLYVAMTRAEERLYIGGALSNRQAAKGELSPDCWHAAATRALLALGAIQSDKGAIVYETAGQPVRAKQGLPVMPDTTLFTTLTALPLWLHQNVRAEARPPRPLAPSSLGRDDVALPPPAAAMRAAAERGRLLHSLFERLPEIAPDQREALALRWLEQSAGVDDAAVRAMLVRDALSIIHHPDYASIFVSDALAEAPLAGVVNDTVISGTVDRLIIGDTEVFVIDFKTGRHVPHSPAQVSRTHLRQMSAYAAVLAGIFPDHRVRAGLLYTSGPKLLMLDDAVIAAHKPPYAD